MPENPVWFFIKLNYVSVGMVTYVIGDLFRSPARVLVNTVNTVGVMGKGIAKDFKTIFPEMFQEYQRLCESGKLSVGKLHLFRTPNKWILNFPTKKHWRNPSRPEFIEAGLKAFVSGYSRNSITSIAFPQLGCGHGELDWEHQVKPLMEKYLNKLPIEVFVHLYRKEVFEVEHRDMEATRDWLRSEPENLGFTEVWEDICAILRGKANFETLDGKRSFSVRITEVPEKGLVLANGAEVFIPQDAMLHTWQYLRSVGFLTIEGLAEGLDAHGDEILALMRELPYLHLAQVARKNNSSGGQFAPALQLIPRPLGKGEETPKFSAVLVPA